MPPAGAHARPRQERLENKMVRLPDLCLPQEVMGCRGGTRRAGRWIESPHRWGCQGGGVEQEPPSLLHPWRGDPSSYPALGQALSLPPDCKVIQIPPQGNATGERALAPCYRWGN